MRSMIGYKSCQLRSHHLKKEITKVKKVIDTNISNMLLFKSCHLRQRLNEAALIKKVKNIVDTI